MATSSHRRRATSAFLRAFEHRGYKAIVIQDGPTFCRMVVEDSAEEVLALFGRAEARDFADVYVLAQHFDKDALLEQTKSLNAGFDLHVLARMMGTLGRFADDEIPLAASDVPLAKAFFSAWAEELQ